MNSSTRWISSSCRRLASRSRSSRGVALLEVLRVVGVVLGDLAQRQVGDVRDDGVEEVAIVRDEDHRVRIGDEVFLEPVARVEIEMVGRLVEQQQVGLRSAAAWPARAASASRRTGDRSAAPAPPARSRGRAARSRPSARSGSRPTGESDPAPRCSARASRRARLRSASRRRAAPRASCISALRSSSGLSARLASSTTVRPLCDEAVLRQVAERQRVRFLDDAGVGLVEPGEHLEQRGLAGAVRSAQADAIAIADLPGDVLEQGLLAERLGDVLKLEHCRA